MVLSGETSGMAEAGMHRTIPALPVREMVVAVAFYVERFGFAVLHHDAGFAVLGRDDARRSPFMRGR
jgi:hypothetical protein